MKKKFNMPDTYVIIFFVVILAAILTHTVPVGKFQMEKVTYTTETGAEKLGQFLWQEVLLMN